MWELTNPFDIMCDKIAMVTFSTISFPEPSFPWTSGRKTRDSGSNPEATILGMRIDADCAARADGQHFACSQSLSFFDRWSRGTKTPGTRLRLARNFSIQWTSQKATIVSVTSIYHSRYLKVIKWYTSEIRWGELLELWQNRVKFFPNLSRPHLITHANGAQPRRACFYAAAKKLTSVASF